MACATIVLVVGLGALWSQYQHRGLRAQHGALMDALDLASKIQSNLDSLRVALASIDLNADAPQRALPFVGPLWSETNSMWWWRGEAIESAGEDELVLAWLQAQPDIVAHAFVAPVASDHAQAAVVVRSAHESGWAAVSFPASLLLPRIVSDAIAPASLRLVRSEDVAVTQAAATIFSVAPSSRARSHAVPIELAGARWRLEYDDHYHASIVREQAPLALLVALLAYGTAVLVLQIQGRSARVSGVLANLEHRFERLNQQYVSALAGQESVQERIQQLSTHCLDTGFLNRSGFRAQTDQMLANAREQFDSNATSLIVLTLEDLDQAVTALGRGALYSVLPKFANRLRGILPDRAIVARSATFELAIAIPNCDSAEAAGFGANLPVSEISGQYTFENGEISLTPRVGVVTSDDSFSSADRLLDDASTAVSVARQRHALWAVFEDAQRDKRVTEIQLRSDFRRALDHNEFRLYYQPILSTYDRKPCGFECLIRWQHPTDGLLSPGQFIPIAEEQGLIGELTMWALREAVSQATQWEHLAEHGAYLSVNLSARDLADPKLVEYITALLRDAGLPPSVLRLEVTETMLIDDLTASRETISALRGAGLAVMMDDFGTGYSSLSYLRELPFNSIKIDGELTRGIAVDSKRYGMLKSIINLIQFLEMDTVIEGVETSDEYELVKPLNPGYCQGYHFARPMPATDAEEYLAGHTMAKLA